MVKSARDVKVDAYKKTVQSSTEAKAAIIKNKGRRSVIFFFRSLNPANWFNEFSNIKITLEEFGPVKKIRKEGSIPHKKYTKATNTYNQNA